MSIQNIKVPPFTKMQMKKGLNEVGLPCHFGEEPLGEWWTGKINFIKECRHKMHQPKQLTNHRGSLLYNKLF